MDKLEFASAEWVDEIRRIIVAGLEGEDLSTIDFAFCEVFTDAPAHLRRSGDARVGWYVRIRNDKVEVGEDELQDAHVKIVGDYQTVLPMARKLVVDPDAVEGSQRAIEMGKIRIEGDPAQFPPILAKLQQEAHDRLASRTA